MPFTRRKFGQIALGVFASTSPPLKVRAMMPLPPVYHALFSFVIAHTPGRLEPLLGQGHAEKLEIILDHKTEGGELRFDAVALDQGAQPKITRNASLSKTDYFTFLNKADLSRSADKRQDIFSFEPEFGPRVLHYGRSLAGLQSSSSRATLLVP